MAPDPLRWTRRSVVMVCVAWAALYGLSAWQLFARVLQPCCAWILSIALVEFAAVMVALSTGFFRVVRGPKRLAALTWLLAAALPILLIVAHASYGFWAAQTRSHRLTFRLRILSPGGEALCDAESRWRYPSWIEGDRIVMIGNPAATSEEAAAAMDRHVERMEAILGSRHPGKVRWVRGSLLGTDGRSMHGYSICGLRLDENLDGLDYVDRHEVAHNVLNDQLPAMSHPPSVVTEGWAQLQSSRSRARAAGLIRLDQREGRELSLRELLSSQWYDNADPQPYNYGEILVDYLVGRSGGAKLLEFCGVCRPETIETDLQRVYGLDLNQLDAAFREHVWEILYGKVEGDYGPLRAILKLPAPGPEDPELRKRLFAEYPAACRRLKAAYRHVSQSGTATTEARGSEAKEYETQRVLPGVAEPIRTHAVATYGEKRDGVPVLESVRRTEHEAGRDITHIKSIEKTQFGPVPDLPALVAGAPAPRPPDDDHVLARVMRRALWAAAGTAALLVLLAGWHIAWSARRRRLTTSSASAPASRPEEPA